MAKGFYRPQLDVARFCAFLAVFCHHALPRTGNRFAFLNDAVDACGFGLCLFFVLSAYLIASLLLRERDSTGTIHLPQFYARRILRVWPLYFLGLGIGVLRSVTHGAFRHDWHWFVAALLFSGNILIPGAILMSHLWSISVEEQFYLLFPCTCARVGRRGILVFALVLIAAANIAIVYFTHQRALLDVAVWFNSLVQFQMFAAGILLALVDARLPKWKTPAAVLAIGVSLALWYVASSTFHLKTEGATSSSALGVSFGYALVALACCLFLVAIQRFPASPPLIYSGKISFGLYVFHIPAIVLVTPHVHQPALAVIVVLALTYVMAALSYRFYESPFLVIKRRFELIPTRAV